MKEDYLWDKTGSDPEIEKLENALKAFRQRDNAPPAIPAKNASRKQIEPKRSIFPFAFAFAASVIFVLILVGVWFQIADRGNSPQDNLVKTTSQKTSEIKQSETIETQTEIPTQVEENPIVEIAEKPAKLKKSKVYKTGKSTKQKVRQTKTVKIAKKQKQTVSAKIEIAELTDEEKYAYNQLMLALSITSEKLNLVKDKVRGETKEETSIKTKIKDRSN